MHISNEDAKEKLEEKGVNLQGKNVFSVNKGNSEFTNEECLLATFGLDSSVSFVVHSDQFSYVINIDMENFIGRNFDKDGNCVILNELKNKLSDLFNSGVIPPKTMYITTASSVSFMFNEINCSEIGVSFDKAITSFMDFCENTYGINVKRFPNHRSEFAAIDSKSGDFYYEFLGCPVKTQIQNEGRIEYLHASGIKCRDAVGTQNDKAIKLRDTVEMDNQLDGWLGEILKRLKWRGQK